MSIVRILVDGYSLLHKWPALAPGRPRHTEAARDALINARLDSALLFTDGISSINYSTRTIAGTVYLLGVAQSQAELDRVFQVTRNIPDVKAVVSHVLLVDDPRRLQQPSVKPSSGT